MMWRWSLLAVALCPGCATTALERVKTHAPTPAREEGLLTGKERPLQIPADWIGEPLPNGQGWRWSDPKNRGNSVRIYRGTPAAPNPVDRSTYVVVTRDGKVLDRNGHSTDETLHD